MVPRTSLAIDLLVNFSPISATIAKPNRVTSVAECNG
mgnify:CR=1 FL=1